MLFQYKLSINLLWERKVTAISSPLFSMRLPYLSTPFLLKLYSYLVENKSNIMKYH